MSETERKNVVLETGLETSLGPIYLDFIPKQLLRDQDLEENLRVIRDWTMENSVERSQ